MKAALPLLLPLLFLSPAALAGGPPTPEAAAGGAPVKELVAAAFSASDPWTAASLKNKAATAPSS